MAPQPTDPTAADRAAAMAQPEVDTLAQLVRDLLASWTKLWVQLFGDVRTLPGAAPAGENRSSERFGLSPDAGAAPSHIDFPAVWTGAVDDGLAEIIDAMDRAAESVHRDVPAAPTARPLAYRKQRVRAALAPSSVAKRGFLAVQEALMQPTHLATEIEGAVSDVLVQEHTEAMRAQLRERGSAWRLIWVSERDACVRCLAYNGHTVAEGEDFPGGHTFGPEWPSVTEQPDLSGPGADMHPHCRCELQLIHAGDVERTADALKREALRSVAKGWARESEGDSVRVAAAKRLLASPAVLPKSVLAETRRRLKAPQKFRRAVP